MFSLFYGLWKYMFSKTELHVLILGIDKAGKTTLLEKLKTLYSSMEGLPPDRIVPTVGLNIGRLVVSSTKLVFWDLGGQVGLRTIWEKYYEEAHGIIYVIDAACPSRFEDSRSALEKLLRNEDLKGAPILILANKQNFNSTSENLRDNPQQFVHQLQGMVVPPGITKKWLFTETHFYLLSPNSSILPTKSSSTSDKIPKRNEREIHQD